MTHAASLPGERLPHRRPGGWSRASPSCAADRRACRPAQYDGPGRRAPARPRRRLERPAGHAAPGERRGRLAGRRPRTGSVTSPCGTWPTGSASQTCSAFFEAVVHDGRSPRRRRPRGVRPVLGRRSARQCVAAVRAAVLVAVRRNASAAWSASPERPTVGACSRVPARAAARRRRARRPRRRVVRRRGVRASPWPTPRAARSPRSSTPRPPSPRRRPRPSLARRRHARAMRVEPGDTVAQGPGARGHRLARRRAAARRRRGGARRGQPAGGGVRRRTSTCPGVQRDTDKAAGRRVRRGPRGGRQGRRPGGARARCWRRSTAAEKQYASAAGGRRTAVGAVQRGVAGLSSAISALVRRPAAPGPAGVRPGEVHCGRADAAGAGRRAWCSSAAPASPAAGAPATSPALLGGAGRRPPAAAPAARPRPGRRRRRLGAGRRPGHAPAPRS